MSRKTHRRQRQQTRHRYRVIPRPQDIYWNRLSESFVKFMASMREAGLAIASFGMVNTYQNTEWENNHEQGYRPQASEES